MKTPAQNYTLNRGDARRVLAEHLIQFEGRNASTRSLNRSVVESFLREQLDEKAALADGLMWDTSTLVRWMHRDCQDRTVRSASQRLAALAGYLQAVHCAGLTATDFMADFRVAHRRCSWEALAVALQSPDPAAALVMLESPPPPPLGPLYGHVQRYVELHESLGKKYRVQRGVLRDLDQHLCAWGVHSPQAVDAAMIQRWVGTMTCTATVQINKTRFVRRFYDYLVGLRIVPHNPLGPARFVEARPDPVLFTPFILRHEQIAAVLAHVERLPPADQFPLRGPTCHMMLALLYALGLRHGEARRLRIEDVNLERQTLLIVQTKFHKSRLIPFGPKLGLRLRTYLDQRRLRFPLWREHDPLFVTCWPKPMSPVALMRAFREGLHAIGITGSNGAPPRLHDLRHSFAVHRLLRWYQEGVNVQNHLPILATFMGHIDITSTQVYLSITSDLLQQANQRFHQHFGSQFDAEVRP